MANTFQCSLCSKECRKRDILCAGCWEGLAEKRKAAIRRSTYRRDEVGRKFLNELLTCDLEVIAQMLADTNGRVMEPGHVAKRLNSKGLSAALNKDEQKKEASEIV